MNLKNARSFVAGIMHAGKAARAFPDRPVATASDAGRAAYDFAFSTICLQHICVHEVQTIDFGMRSSAA